MGWALVRYQNSSGESAWGCRSGGKVFPLATPASNLSELLKADVPALAKAALSGSSLDESSLKILSPVTAPCQIVCQGKNYLDHLLETGFRPENKEHNLLFSKADSSLTSAIGTVKRPEGVKLLDYEIELGLVIGKEIKGPVNVDDKGVGQYVAGLVIGNDVSARDVQIPERQWFRGKSFRNFCPVGPVFYFMEPSDWAQLYSLNLELKVNGQIRQKASTGQLMHRPPETISLISRVFDLRVGDLILTGTPGGVSMKVPPKKKWEEIADLFLSDKAKFAGFVQAQEASGRYLKNGDKVEASIVSADGKIDLGKQSWVVG